jgi:riboflavin synthase
MFSGLIVHRGTVEENVALADGGTTLRVSCDREIITQVAPKDSVCVNGVCLTATAVEGDTVRFDVVPETLACSTLGKLQKDERVNLELALRLGDRIGGHFVYGHVDTAARVLSRGSEGQGARMRIELPPTLAHYICEKAFVSVDGVSLTVAAVAPGSFEVALIPETLARTTLGERTPSDAVNLEVDPLARYAVGAPDGHLSDAAAAELDWAYEI